MAGAMAGLVLLNPPGTCKHGCPWAPGARKVRPVPAREGFSPDEHQGMPVLHRSLRPWQELATRLGVPSSRLRVQRSSLGQKRRRLLLCFDLLPPCNAP